MQVRKALWRLLQTGGCRLHQGGSSCTLMDPSTQLLVKAGIGDLIRDPYGNMIMAFSAEVLAKFPLESELLALQ